MKDLGASVGAALLLLLLACSTPSPEEAGRSNGSTAGGPGAGRVEGAAEIDLLASIGEEGFVDRRQVWQDGFDDMVERRVVRVAVTASRTMFFIDGGRQRGMVAEALQEFEKFLNKELKLPRSRPLSVLAVPVSRDRLISSLVEGRADLAAASLTITPERLEQVDFSEAAARDVKEVVVTGPRSPRITGLADLAGQSVMVRRSSSYWESLQDVSDRLVERGLEPIDLEPVSEILEDEDLLHMVEAGLIPITVVDDFQAELWTQVLDDLIVHSDYPVAVGGDVAWAIRPTATGLKEVVDRFVAGHGQGTLFGNVLINRYLKDAEYLSDIQETESRKRFDSVLPIFREYAGRYGFDYLMVTAQGYQESRLDQSLKSRAGAIGIMQLLPSTARDPAVGIEDIDRIENNIHAGVRYLRHLADTYFNEAEISDEDRVLFSFAGYNAGPTRIRQMRVRASDMGLDPNVWFGNVEIATADAVGREPVDYVRQIFKYYVSYRLILDQEGERERLRSENRG